MIILGALAMIAGAVGYEVSNHAAATSLATLAVAPTDAAMVATATGNGGANPTSVLPGAKQGTAAAGVGGVPTTPTLYLQPATLEQAGVSTGQEAAYWKVWWDSTSQVEAVVSLQQHLDDSSAQSGASQLASQNNDPSSFQMKQVGTVTLPDVPGANGYVWAANVGTAKDPLPVELRFVTFSAGSRVALVSMTAYGKSSDAADFTAFATNEFNKLDASPTSDSKFTGEFAGLAGVGLLVLVIGIIRLLFALRRRSRRLT